MKTNFSLIRQKLIFPSPDDAAFFSATLEKTRSVSLVAGGLSGCYTGINFLRLVARTGPGVMSVAFGALISIVSWDVYQMTVNIQQIIENPLVRAKAAATSTLFLKTLLKDTYTGPFVQPFAESYLSSSTQQE